MDRKIRDEPSRLLPMNRSDLQLKRFGHEVLRVERGPRSDVAIAVAVHSTQAGPAIGGCRIKSYSDWRDGITDATRLAAAMTEKCSLAGLPHGGGKAVVMDPGTLRDTDVRHLVLEDLADLITGLGGTYITGPDIGSTPEDMDVLHQMTGGLSFCRPEASGGSGNSSNATAQGVIAALVAGAEHVFSTRSLAGLRAGIIGYGSVGSLIAESLASRGCMVTVAEANQQRRRDVEAVGLVWAQGDLLEEDLDILVPAAVGGLLSPETARACRARLIVGPANNQLTDDGVASILHDNGITWVPDVVASAGGIIHAVCREEMGLGQRETAGRIAAIGATTAEILAESRDLAITPHTAARNISARRQKEMA